jgi:hypothetical protein
MARTLKTSRQDIYKRLVEDGEADSDAIFKYNYELFSLGVIHGFFNGDQKKDHDGWSQDYVKLSDINQEEHRQTIELVCQMVKIESGKTEEDEIWTEVLEYADRGVELIDDAVSTQGDFDLVGLVQTSEAEDWESRLVESLGDPGELDGVRSRS